MAKHAHPPMKKKLKVVDLFCGIGGLTNGLIKEGLNVVAGIDNDGSCRFGYEHNNRSRFIHKEIKDVTAAEINQLFGSKRDTIRVLVGCAPCQPFSRYNPKGVTSKQLEPLEHFAALIKETLPDVVSMENVSGLARMKVFRTFVKTLEDNDYRCKYEIVDASEFGVPQKRMRLILLASRLGEIGLIPRTHKGKPVTVRDVISTLEPISDGEASKRDPLHRASKLSDLNLRRIKATPADGGSSKSWDESLMLDCHKRASGRSYRHSVYGRMRWDDPAPTMTTQCIGLGNGRFGHPEQHRAISLREAAEFQTFPKTYRFHSPEEPLVIGTVAKFIGNAVPVRLGAVIGKSIKKHLRQYV